MLVTVLLLLFHIFLSFFLLFLFTNAFRHTRFAHGVPFHTQLRLNASLRIGTSVAVEHCTTRLTDSLTDSPGRRWPFKPPPCQCCRCAAVGAPPMCRTRTQLARPQRMPPRLLPLAPLKRERAECSPPSKLITRAALSARRLSRRGLGLCPCRRVKFTTALPLGVSLSRTPHRAQLATESEDR